MVRPMACLASAPAWKTVRQTSSDPRPPPSRGHASRGQALDRKHMPSSHDRLGLIAPAIDQTFHRHLLVGQKATEANVPRSVAFTQLAQTYVLTRNHAFEQHRPL